jgi:hypothetical protein
LLFENIDLQRMPFTQQRKSHSMNFALLHRFTLN